MELGDIMGEERIEIIQHDDCQLEIKTHGFKGVDCDEILEMLKKCMPDEDFSNVKWTREHDEPSTRRRISKSKKQVRRG